MTIVSAKSIIYSPRGYLSPGNSIVLEIAATLIIHQRHNFLLTFGLNLFKLKHASNKPVCFCDFFARTVYSALPQKSFRIVFQPT